MANINRGEFDLTINDQTYTLVLTLDDLGNLETLLDVGAEELFDKIRTRTVRATHINAVLVRSFAKARPRLTRKEIDLLLPGISYVKRREAVGLLIAGALNFLNEQNAEEDTEGQPEKKQQEEPTDPLSATGD